ncbi:MAG: TRAP transporter large permease [Methylacidiphilales bacterium]|nr:TRAP transporter large permease [Candidatus Methylacidiphilales bacterium]
MSFVFIWIFILLMAFGMPIAIVLLCAPLLSLIWDGQSDFFVALVSRMYHGINSFPLMAVPFFVLAGELMNLGGVSNSIIALSRALLGHLRGGILHISVMSSVLFAGLTGSAVAEASALGKVMIPIMEKEGIGKRFGAALVIAGAIIGPIIPPSGLMILYSYVMNLNVAALFAGGIIPGLLMGIALTIYNVIIARVRNYPANATRASIREIWAAFKECILPLMMPIIIIVGVLSGVFTITESSVIAVIYVLLITLFRNPTSLRELPQALASTVRQSSVILFLVGAAVSFGWLVTVSGMAEFLSKFVTESSTNIYMLLFIFNILLLGIGMFLDAGPAILILGPALGPTFVEHGVHPVQFAIIMCVNLSIGLATPPVGLVFNSVCSLTKIKLEEMVRELLPLLGIEILVVFLITYIPELTLWIPRTFNLL